MLLRQIYIRILVYKGKAVDIWSSSKYPGCALSNLAPNGFVFEGIKCGSMEGFLQSLKYRDRDEQRRICALAGIEAKRMTTPQWQTDQTVWWNGESIDRRSAVFSELVSRAYSSLYHQNDCFREALISTKGKKLFHSRGEQNPYKTILTESEFVHILTQLRDNIG